MVLSITEERPGAEHAAVWLKDLQIWEERKPANQHFYWELRGEFVPALNRKEVNMIST